MHCTGVIIHNLFTILYKLHPPVLFLALVNVKPLKAQTLSHLVLYLLQAETCLHNGAVHVAKGSRAPQPLCHMFLHVLLQAQTVTKILKCNYVLCLLVCLACFLGSIGIPVVSLVKSSTLWRQLSFHTYRGKKNDRFINYALNDCRERFAN